MNKHTVILKSLDYIAKILWKFVVFFFPQPIPQNLLLSLCTSPAFCPSYCPAFCSAYSTWPDYNWLHIFHSKQAQTVWNTIPTSHVAPQHTADREASYSESQGLTAKATQLRCLDKNSCWATTRYESNPSKAVFHRLRDTLRCLTWPAL